ncbi:MAG: hypothetical protein AABX85_04880 [Nanoarchaeota archaeon]
MAGTNSASNLLEGQSEERSNVLGARGDCLWNFGRDEINCPSYFLYRKLAEYKVPYNLGVSDLVHREKATCLATSVINHDIASFIEVQEILSKQLSEAHARNIAPKDYSLILFGYGLTLPEHRQRLMSTTKNKFSGEKIDAFTYWSAKSAERFRKEKGYFPFGDELLRLEDELKAPFESTFALSVLTFGKPLVYPDQREIISQFDRSSLDTLYEKGLIN